MEIPVLLPKIFNYPLTYTTKLKKLKTGDLVQVPAGAYRIKFRSEDDDGQMSIPWDCNMLMEPKIGIFKNFNIF